MHYAVSVKQTMLDAVYFGAISTFLIQTCVSAALLAYGAHLVVRGELHAEVLLAFMLYQSQLQEYVLQLMNSYTALVKSSGAGDKVFALLDRRPHRRGARTLVPPAPSTATTSGDRGGGGGGAIVCAARPLARGHVALRDVHFAYPTRPREPVLAGLSLEVWPGQCAALVGASGAGKSTVFHLLENLYQPAAPSAALPGGGRGPPAVSLDGFDVAELDHAWLHRAVALVGQEPVLFSGSVRRNVLYALGEPDDDGDDDGAAEDDARVARALEAAHAAEFVARLPHGARTEVGERGAQLSGGQKQRVAIARALVREPAVLLLDEATSALDAASERAVQAAIDAMIASGRMTVLVIAHRLSTVRSADMIFALERGAVAETGTHDQLLARGGLYAQLVERQRAAGLDDRQAAARVAHDGVAETARVK